METGWKRLHNESKETGQYGAEYRLCKTVTVGEKLSLLATDFTISCVPEICALPEAYLQRESPDAYVSGDS